MKLFDVVMELYCHRHFSSYAAVWPVRLCSLEYRKSFPNINKKFLLRLLFSGHYNIFFTAEFFVLMLYGQSGPDLVSHLDEQME